MPVDMRAWRKALFEVVDSIADEELQRRSWLGSGPEEWSPDEAFCQYFGDAGAEEFLGRTDTGLSQRQIEAGRELTALMRQLSDETPAHIKPADLIDDPRWRKIREAAARFRVLLLKTGNMAA
jgi:hypothetical protein